MLARSQRCFLRLTNQHLRERTGQGLAETIAELAGEEYNPILRCGRAAAEGLIGAAIITTAAANSGTDLDAIFTAANANLGDQLKMVAKFIATLRQPDWLYHRSLFGSPSAFDK